MNRVEIINNLNSDIKTSLEYEIDDKSAGKVILVRINSTKNSDRISFMESIKEVFGNLANIRPKNKKSEPSIGVVEIDGFCFYVKAGEKKNGKIMPKNPTAAETNALNGLEKQIQSIKSTNDIQSISIIINGERFDNIGACKNVSGTPKADFALYDSSNRPVVFISHKKGSSAKDFQQWSGTEKYPSLRDNPIMKKFIAELSKICDKTVISGKIVPTLKSGQSFMSIIPSTTSDGKKLINQSVYGIDFGKSFSNQNCNFVIQGMITLEYLRTEENVYIYELKANHLMKNGEIPKGDYAAAIYGFYNGERSNGGINNCRIGIYPKVFKNNAKQVKI